MKFKGSVRKFKDNVNTDEIIPARYLNTSIPKELALHCMEDIDPNFIKKAKPGDIIIAGKNFGCGSSREHAPLAIKAFGISCVIAESFARIFYRNAVNIGLPVVEVEKVKNVFSENDNIEVDLIKGEIILKNNRKMKIKPLPDFMRRILLNGGLMNSVKSI